MKIIYQNYRLLMLTMISVVIIIGITACSDDPVSSEEIEEITSLLVINEGNWSDGNGSLTSYHPETAQVVQNKFQQANGRPLAGIIQSMVLAEDRIFIVANNMDKMEVVDAETMESLSTMTFDGDHALTPSSFAASSAGKGYVSGLYSNLVAVIDLENYTVTDTRIDVGMNPGDMIIAGNHLFVANSGFGDDNTVTVIDTGTDEVITTIETGSGPLKLIRDSLDRIWVVSNGKKAYDESWNRDPENDIPGRIDVLNASSLQLITTIETGGYPKSIAVSNELGRAWVVNEETVQLIDINSYELIDDNFIGRSFNGIGYSGVESRLYLADTKGYEQAGQAIIFSIEAAAVDSFQTGIAPRDFIF
jgi:YVTN family beta-propeller protein